MPYEGSSQVKIPWTPACSFIVVVMRISVRQRIDAHTDKQFAGAGDAATLKGKGAFLLVKRLKTISILSKVERNKCLACSVQVGIVRRADQIFDLFFSHTN